MKTSKTRTSSEVPSDDSQVEQGMLHGVPASVLANGEKSFQALRIVEKRCIAIRKTR